MGKMPVFASWQKGFSDHFAACSSLKKARVHKIFSSSQLNCSGARHRYNVQELKKAQLELCLPEKSRGEGSFSLVCCLDGADSVMPYNNLGNISDIFHGNNQDPWLERRVQPPRSVP